MDLRVDQKGKFYSPRVNKESIPVLLRTIDQVIIGSIYVRPERRVSDELNDPHTGFLSLTNARVYDLRGEEMQYETGFLLLNRAQIVALAPLEELTNAADRTWVRDLPTQEA
jgi:hypothetical protein